MPKREFKLPFLGIDEMNGLTVLYGEGGDLSVIMHIENPVVNLGADATAFEACQSLFANILKILGEGFILHKQDVFARDTYTAPDKEDFLQQKYYEHFSGREFTAHACYLTITKPVSKNAFYVYDKKACLDLQNAVTKIVELLRNASVFLKLLDQPEIDEHLSRLVALQPNSKSFSFENFKVRDTDILMGERALRYVSMVDIDAIEFPETVSPYRKLNNGLAFTDFPVDNLTFLPDVPHFSCMVYNQLIEIPNQAFTLNKLQLKRKRHSGVPDPANRMCVEDIDQLLTDVARDNQLLVNAHFGLLICADSAQLEKCCNYVEAAFFQHGIVPSKNAYNQLELFRSVFPGNGVELKNYDWFLTTSDAALCLLYKERLSKSEYSNFLIHFADRKGLPIGIDLADLPMETGRISNRSKFVLGASGTGKSFFMNSLLEQYMLYNFDVVIVDVGHSYSGLCSYFKGKYYTYSETSPITMNPFHFTEQQYNIKKKDFLKTLLGLLLKGTEGNISQVEDTVFSTVLSAYYADYFAGTLHIDLCFDSFYHYSISKIEQMKLLEPINFNLSEYRFILRKFCRGGDYGKLLNEASNQSDFNERFIVYEIDSIKENKILFPIVTLIIMDIVLQKMRLRTRQRKALVLEEAWKAIASPLMAGYIVYLYKTMRKFWGEPIIVTQELNDIIGNPVVNDTILASSDTICLLDQSKYRQNYDDIARLLSLNAVEQRKIFTINALDNKSGRGKFKEVYIKRGNSGEVYGIEVSLYQYLTFTTEKPEKTAVEYYLRQHSNYRDGLEHFVADFKSSRLSLPAFIQFVNNKLNSDHHV